MTLKEIALKNAATYHDLAKQQKEQLQHIPVYDLNMLRWLTENVQYFEDCAKFYENQAQQLI